MNVAMGAMPDAMFVIHEVIANTAVGGIAPNIGEVSQPGLLKADIGREVGVQHVVAGDEPIGVRAGVGANAVAGDGEPLPVGISLSAVVGRGVTAEAGASGAEFG